LTGTLCEGVRTSRNFVFFITDGILESQWCLQELKWAVEMDKNIVLVRETDGRHGGIGMNEFFTQVPPELIHVFRENIAIPWYREPAFRSVSVSSILKACELGDPMSQDVAKLNALMAKLQRIHRRAEVDITCIDVIDSYSWAMKVVFFIGGFAQFKSPVATKVYVAVFNLSFWCCGLMCLSNMVYHSVPYHIFSTDVLTAYVHLPAWQSWYRWRQFVLSTGCDDLLTSVLHDKSRGNIIGLACRICGWLVLVVQTVMVLDVLFGFSLPRTLGLGRAPGHEEWGKHPNHGVAEFTAVHAYAMWAIIPPVISAMFASYTMFAFVAFLHFLDARSLNTQIVECISMLTGFFAQKKKKKKNQGRRKTQVHQKSEKKRTSRAPGSALLLREGTEQEENEDSHSDTNGAPSSNCSDNSEPAKQQQASLEEVHRQNAHEKELCDLVVEVLRQMFGSVQSRIDHTCKSVGNLWLHLVFFSTCQVLAISTSAVMHASGAIKADYKWWWALQDVFHLGGGLVLLAACMGVFCIVTSFMQRLTLRISEVIGSTGAPFTMQATILGLVSARPLGMHVLWGSTYIDASKALIFFGVILITVVHSMMYVVNYVDLSI